MRIGLFLLLGLVFFALAVPRLSSEASPPRRLLIVGIPAWGPSWLSQDGKRIPAGCGPEAARLLLWYWATLFNMDLVRDDPEGALRALHSLMDTVTVHWEGVDQGLTWPWNFSRGLEVYAQTHLPQVRVRSLSGSREEVFAHAVELLQSGNPPVLLFDWVGLGGIFPNHYALVVGYDLREEELVVNPGWGYSFQAVPFTHGEIAPVQLFWLEFPEPKVPRRPLALPLETCPTVRSYGKDPKNIPWCGPTRAEELGSGLVLLLWD
ncbi:MAG: C39 family peptidase [Candidatus Bipolaricaulota bacterium]|nr:C39 family peptidase [Candidatus Bipolaricaulota bacterium]MDW8126363.1 hypothetical protein [Candidatus Bipolaricaulota bacterium]